MTDNNASGKSLLLLQLANILGINSHDDQNYVSDILESLIDIGDCIEDVVEYMTSFVGNNNNEDERIRQLSIDIQRFKRGGTVAVPADEQHANTTKDAVAEVAAAINSGETARKILDEAAAQRRTIQMNAQQKQHREKKMAVLKKKEVEEEQRRLWEEAVSARDVRLKSNSTSGASNLVCTSTKVVPSQETMLNDATSTEKARVHQRKTTASEQQVIKPQKGMPKNKPCGCFGNMHKPLKNCLSCGRISCELEGINDYCHFCGYFIGGNNNYVQDDAKLESAIRHKESLLEFDRKSASRTQILDDQEDYFVAATSVWSTEQERGKYHDMEKERQKKMHDRRRNVISFN